MTLKKASSLPLPPPLPTHSRCALIWYRHPTPPSPPCRCASSCQRFTHPVQSCTSSVPTTSQCSFGSIHLPMAARSLRPVAQQALPRHHWAAEFCEAVVPPFQAGRIMQQPPPQSHVYSYLLCSFLGCSAVQAALQRSACCAKRHCSVSPTVQNGTAAKRLLCKGHCSVMVPLATEAQGIDRAHRNTMSLHT